jgi:hypothetical protein
LQKSKIEISAKVKEELIVLLVILQRPFFVKVRLHEGSDDFNPEPLPKFDGVIASRIFFEAGNEPRFVGSILRELI